MKKSKKTTRFLSCALTTLVVGQFSKPVFASQSETELLKQNSIQIEAIDSNSLSVENSGNKEIVTVNETDGIRTITITNSVTGQNDYIVYNQNTNTVYSSITGKTIDLNENQDLDPNAATISPRSVSSYETKYISYAQIKSIVGGGSSAAAVIGAILYFVPGAQEIGGAIGAISTIVGTINGNVSASSSHGIRLKVKVTKYYRTRLGKKQVYRITRSITSYGFYSI